MHAAVYHECQPVRLSGDWGRYGVFGDWKQPYLTLEPKYEAAQLRVFGKLVTAGHIYRGRKPVHWSPSSATALAEAELEYPEGHTSRSIYVAMPLVSTGAQDPWALGPAFSSVQNNCQNTSNHEQVSDIAACSIMSASTCSRELE